ncbi:MAG: SRPBCC family protein [Dehalococcoidia bacterium]|nr:SRPBCC family protein [Dehalococcoidia bacterium]
MPKVKQSITVAAPVDVVYRAWHNFQNFPRFMDNIEDVRVASGGRSHWRAKGPLGTAPEWDAEVTLDEPERAIGWRSVHGSATTTAGRVNFASHGGETEIKVTIEYEPPAGVVGGAVSKIFADPERQVDHDLHAFKQIIEDSARLARLDLGERLDDDEALGASMGNNSESELEAIADTNSGISPRGVDDPATRPG